ncbi:hypothetical protein BJ165DRAFT_1534600 [Panaeolus papilionaceus]|nr:hypothetical protein BJ165DRAFT_1534600 [Panaeolus papilionaceus]
MASRPKRNHLDVRSTPTSSSPESVRKKAKKVQANRNTSSTSVPTMSGKAAKDDAEDVVECENSDEEIDQILNNEDEPDDENGVGDMTDKNRSDVVHIQKSIDAYPSYVNKKRSGTTELHVAPDGCVYLSNARYCAVVDKDRCTNVGCRAQLNCYKRVNHKQQNQACASCAMRGRTCKSSSSRKVTFVDLSKSTNTLDGATSQTEVINNLLAAFQDSHNKTNEFLQKIAKQGESILALQSAVMGISPNTLSDPCAFDEAIQWIRQGAQQTTQETDQHEMIQGSGKTDVVVNGADRGPLEDNGQISPSVSVSRPASDVVVNSADRGPIEDNHQISPSVSVSQPLASVSQPASRLLIGTGHLKHKASDQRKALKK